MPMKVNAYVTNHWNCWPECDNSDDLFFQL